MRHFTSLLILGLVLSCSNTASGEKPSAASQPAKAKSQKGAFEDASNPKNTAIFAGGCFWCSETDFEKIQGVLEAESGYIGGHVKNPTYKEVSRGGTGHTEAVRVRFDPAVISYDALVKKFWFTIDPTTPDRQFCDRGSQYRPGIFFLDDTQKKAALKSKADIEKIKPFSAPLQVEITKATTFTVAEEYHQDFYKKSTAHYTRYRLGCGRDKRIKELWGPLAVEK